MKKISACVVMAFVLIGCTTIRTDYKVYDVGTSLQSRSISFENTTGDKGAGGKAASGLGVGRKGSPARMLAPGETIVFCDIDGPGVIRHIWMTQAGSVEVLQGVVIRVYWDEQTHPSIEAPIGPFFGLMHGQVSEYQSAVHSVNAKAGLNSWMEMPFREHVKIEVVNESAQATPVFYSIDYTLGDELPAQTGYLHAVYRRENPTTLTEDFEILPAREGKGRFLGCILGIHTLSPRWWGEGEVKVYLDGDEESPTICGTGTEDYVGQSWGLQDATHLYTGTSLHPGDDLKEGNKLSTIYRWHIRDPIYWSQDIRVTIQQIGYSPDGYFERQDDWSVCSFWYEPLPSAPLPVMPDFDARIVDYVPAKEGAAK